MPGPLLIIPGISTYKQKTNKLKFIKAYLKSIELVLIIKNVEMIKSAILLKFYLYLY